MTSSPSKKFNSPFWFLLISVALLTFLWWGSLKISNQWLSQNRVEKQGSRLDKPKENQFPKGHDGYKNLNHIHQFITSEALKVGRVDIQPEQSQARIKKCAQALPLEGWVQLQNLALNEQLEADQRFLSAFILSQVDDPKVIPFLQTVVQAPIRYSKQKSRLYEQEIVIRSQTLMGLRRWKAHPLAQQAAMELATKVDDAFLARLVKLLK